MEGVFDFHRCQEAFIVLPVRDLSFSNNSSICWTLCIRTQCTCRLRFTRAVRVRKNGKKRHKEFTVDCSNNGMLIVSGSKGKLHLWVISSVIRKGWMSHEFSATGIIISISNTHRDFTSLHHWSLQYGSTSLATLEAAAHHLRTSFKVCCKWKVFFY